ncbi:spore germination lipoprotein GerD [Caldalkalibacillus mannanilyticus]|uniref:spore germination lipoprotein GerD n=1 Tax=Caldalkalibacillus mannanilyticus TaxID=1418 RepID=UPI000469C509|nr:spore germination lipoprotein GerD [Caldalkalibacillus mannanilyticus]
MKHFFLKKTMTLLLAFVFIVLMLFVSSCAPEEQTAKPDYKETKQMVVDILQTDEGKKAVEEVMQEDKVKQELLLDEPFVKKTIETTILNPENTEKLKEIMSDPEFMKEYAKQLEDEHKKLIKDLMKDPQYRASLIEVLKDPEMEKQFLEMAKSNEFRQQTMSVMKDAIQSPYFRLELLELLGKVAESPPEDEKKKKEEGGGGSEGEESS